MDSEELARPARLGARVRPQGASHRENRAQTGSLEGSLLPPRTGPVTSPPDLLVEVVSASPRDERRDRVEKMGEYARFGVLYYWLVDPALGSVEIFELVGGHYSRVVGVTDGVIDDVPGCPGLRLDVDALWSELARLPEARGVGG